MNFASKKERDAFIVKHLPLVTSIASRFERGDIPFEDLQQEGYVGLIHAVDHFEPEKGQFSTIATPWIRGAISRFLKKERTVPLLATDEKDYKHKLEILASKRVAEDEADEAQEEQIQLMEECLGKLSPREADVIRLRFGMGTTDQEPVNLEDIAEKYNVTAQAIHWVEKTALAKLRKMMGAKEPVKRKPFEGEDISEFFKQETGAQDSTWDPDAAICFDEEDEF